MVLRPNHLHIRLALDSVSMDNPRPTIRFRDSIKIRGAGVMVHAQGKDWLDKRHMPITRIPG